MSPLRQIRAAFDAARDPGSPGGASITTLELQRAVRPALADGKLTATEKRVIRDRFEESSYTPAAGREYLRLQAKHGLSRLESLRPLTLPASVKQVRLDGVEDGIARLELPSRQTREVSATHLPATAREGHLLDVVRGAHGVITLKVNQQATDEALERSRRQLERIRELTRNDPGGDIVL